MPRISTLVRCDRLVSEPLVIEKHFVFLLFSEFYFKPTSYSISEDSEEEPIEEEWYRIFTKGQKQSQNRQNRARDWKEHKKSKSTQKSKSQSRSRRNT
ncbi:hypothetical protein Tco_0348649 [Tanacetum coccineum]